MTEVTRKLTIAKAISEAIGQRMTNDPSVFVMGEDIGVLGGAFGNTQGLFEQFGAERVRDTPISESALVGASVGAATQGLRPVTELMFVDFIGVCLDPLYNLAAKNSYFSGGKQAVPMVLMTSVGGGIGDAGQHSQCLYATFAHLPGIKVVMPSNAYDAKGLMISAILDDNPVVVMMHKALQGIGWLGTVKESVVDVPIGEYTVDIGKAKVVRYGKDVTIVGMGATLHMANEAATTLALSGVDAEVIDLRSIVPLDLQTIRESVNKTGRLLVVDDDYRQCGIAAEIIASIAECDDLRLSCSPKRLSYPDIPPPYSRPMEQYALPSAEKIVPIVKNMMAQNS